MEGRRGPDVVVIVVAAVAAAAAVVVVVVMVVAFSVVSEEPWKNWEEIQG